MAGTKKTVKLGPVSAAATGVVALFALLFLGLVVFFGVVAVVSVLTMLLFGVLHAEVALGIPAFGYWASFWITTAVLFVASFFS